MYALAHLNLSTASFILYFMFQDFGLKLPISGLILTIFGDK